MVAWLEWPICAICAFHFTARPALRYLRRRRKKAAGLLIQALFVAGWSCSAGNTCARESYLSLAVGVRPRFLTDDNDKDDDNDVACDSHDADEAQNHR